MEFMIAKANESKQRINQRKHTENKFNIGVSMLHIGIYTYYLFHILVCTP